MSSKLPAKVVRKMPDVYYTCPVKGCNCWFYTQSDADEHIRAGKHGELHQW